MTATSALQEFDDKPAPVDKEAVLRDITLNRYSKAEILNMSREGVFSWSELRSAIQALNENIKSGKVEKREEQTAEAQAAKNADALKGWMLIAAIVAGIYFFPWTGLGIISKKTPEMKAAEAKEREQKAKRSEISRIADSKLGQSARHYLRRYTLESGEGICEEFVKDGFDSLTRGTAIHELGRRVPAVIGAYSGVCKRHHMGVLQSERQTYYFRFTDVNGMVFGNILTSQENMDRENYSPIIQFQPD